MIRQKRYYYLNNKYLYLYYTCNNYKNINFRDCQLINIFRYRGIYKIIFFSGNAIFLSFNKRYRLKFFSVTPYYNYVNNTKIYDTMTMERIKCTIEEYTEISLTKITIDKETISEHYNNKIFLSKI